MAEPGWKRTCPADGAAGITRNLISGDRASFVPTPSQETSIENGFVQISRFFNPGKDVLAEIEERLIERIFPDAKDGENFCYEDQYISSGGQLYEMLTGKDRFVADVRASLFRYLKRHGRRTGHVCHPYDLAAHLIGEEVGILLTDASGQPLDAPMETTWPCEWIGYANAGIQQQVAEVFTQLLIENELIEAP